MSLTSEPLIRRFPLMKEKIIKRSLSNAALPIVIGVILSVAALFINPFLAAAILTALLLALVAIAYYNILYYDNYFYDLAREGLVIGKGVIGSWRITVPSHKIQDVYLDQDLLDRIFGLYDLHLSTATDASEREAHIDGISLENANSMRSLLLNWLTGSADSHEEPGQAEAAPSFRPGRAGLAESLVTSVIGTTFLLIWIAGPYGLLAAIFLVPFAVAVSYLDYKAVIYTLRRDGVMVRTGFFIPKESMFLYRNIQDVEDQQNIWDRLFRTHTLVIKTMTASSAVNAKLKYISPDRSQAVREHILEQSRKSSIESKAESPAGAVAEPSRTEAPKMSALEIPYGNHFLRSAAYQASLMAIAALAIIVASVLAVLLLGGATLPAGLSIAGLVLLLLAIGLVMLLIGAAISTVSYTYQVAQEYVQVQIRFITTTKRQMLYRKIQDLEEHVSFANSFAGLADMKLETGSKEMIQSRNSQYAASASVTNEMVPALVQEDARKLRAQVARQMGISLAGLGTDPLRGMIPLSKRKPLKKTMWWILLSAFLLAAALAAILLLHFNTAAIPLIAILLGTAVALKYWYELEYLRRYGYDYNGDVLTIRKGVFGHRELTIPFNKIQDVYVNRDLLDLAFGLYDVHVSTATSRSLLNAHIDGLEAVNAEAAALLLAQNVSKSR